MSDWTGSTSDRVFACPPSVALPAVFEPGGADARAGTDGHAALETYIATGTGLEAAVAALGTDPRYVLPEGIHRTERAYAYSPVRDEAREIVTDGHRGYVDIREDEIPMTLDVVTRGGLHVGASATVTDWKLGNSPVYPDSWQLTLAALAVSRAHGLDEVTVQIVQKQPSGPPAVRSRTLDTIDLAVAADAVRRTWERVTEARALVASGRVPDVRRGDHCTYCPAWRSCPATVALARGVLDLQVADVASVVAALAPAEAGHLYERMKAGEKFLDEIKKALSEYAGREPLPLADGRRVELVTVAAERAEMAPTGNKIPYTYTKLQVRGKAARKEAAE